MNLMNTYCRHFLRKHRLPFSLISLHSKRISQVEARRIMQIPNEDLHLINEDYLRKQYLKLAKIYHPDA